MTTKTRLWLLAACAASVLLALLALMLRSDAPPPSPVTVVSRPVIPIPVAAAPAPARATPPAPAPVAPVGVRQDYIVQADSVELARSAVVRVGGVVTGDLSIIRAVGAALDDRELEALRASDVPRLRIFEDSPVQSSSAAGVLPETNYPSEVAASNLHVGGVTGRGVTVAVLDSGVWSSLGPLQTTPYQTPHVLAQYDVIQARTQSTYSLTAALQNYSQSINDLFGHGTHISSIIASSGVATTGKFQGVAPGGNLVSVRVLDSTGAGRYFDVISGIQWVVKQRLRYNIRVINLSLGAPPQSPYWDDPLDQAVMSAWASGIVVVAAAGNRGPQPMTINAPGNVPYVITVGAVTDAYHPMQPLQYQLASFSSTGPTYEGFVKPELVGMGGHILAYAPNNGTLAQEFPQWVGPYNDFTMSGTSQATAVVSGVVALMLQVNPSLTPDQVKCRLMSGAHPAVTSKGVLAYTVFQQGSGLVDAHDAVYGNATNCANQGLNVALDLAGLQHYGGRANRDANGNYYIMSDQKTTTCSSSGGGLLGGLVGGLLCVVKDVLSIIPLLGDGL